MAFKHYLAVCDSSLYQGKPIVKAVLSRIAYLVRDKGNPLGWCTASQPYLAAQLGCSRRTIEDAVRILKEDGAIVVRMFRDEKKQKRNWYQANMEMIQAHNRYQEATTGETVGAKYLELIEEDEDLTNHDMDGSPTTYIRATYHGRRGYSSY